MRSARLAPALILALSVGVVAAQAPPPAAKAKTPPSADPNNPLSKEEYLTPPKVIADAVLASRSDARCSVATDLIARDRAGRLSPPLPDIAASFLHMHANRLLQSAPREHELLLYEFLTRLLAADVHRRRSAVGPM